MKYIPTEEEQKQIDGIKEKYPNLKPFTERSPEERRELARLGGLKRAENIAARKKLAEELLNELTKRGRGKALTHQQEMVQNIIGRAKKSDRAFEVVRDTIGEKPVETVDSLSEIKVVFDDEYGK